MAFDISYRYMPANEQNFLIEKIAGLKDARRVEALRESGNSIHVFVFQKAPPSEDAVRAFMELMDERPRLRHGRHAGLS
jgi:hypothetical protein